MLLLSIYLTRVFGAQFRTVKKALGSVDRKFLGVVTRSWENSCDLFLYTPMGQFRRAIETKNKSSMLSNFGKCTKMSEEAASFVRLGGAEILVGLGYNMWRKEFAWICLAKLGIKLGEKSAKTRP